jgi:hypothetical protein
MEIIGEKRIGIGKRGGGDEFKENLWLKSNVLLF